MTTADSDVDPGKVSRDAVLERVRFVLKDLLNLETIEVVTPEARLLEDLGLDSLAMVDLIIAIEESFALKLQSANSVALFESVRTVEDAADLIFKLETESRESAHVHTQLA